MEQLDLNFVRSHFPAFSEEKLKDKAFFENAGGSYMCKQVIERFDRYFKQRKVQPYGFYEASALAGEEMDSARARMAEYLNVNTDEVLFGPSKAANAGGVAVSGLEITQNLQRLSWTSEDLQKQLRTIMDDIHEKCVEYGSDKNENYVDYVKGANLAGFIKVANAMIAYGVV